MSRKTIEQIRSEVYGKPQSHVLTINRETDIDVEARTVKLAFASDKPIDNWWYGQIRLMMGKKNVRTQRFDQGAALLMDHNTRDQVGVIEDYSFDSDGMARCTVRFSKSAHAEEIFQDVRDGIRKNISVGFMIWELNLESKSKDAPSVYRADDWEPYEVSIVSVPADISVGVGRSMWEKRDDAPDGGEICPECEMPIDDCTCEQQVSEARHATRAISTKTEKTMAKENGNEPDAPVVETRSAEEIQRAKDKSILEWAGIFGEDGQNVAREMIATSPDVTLDDVRVAIHAKRKETQTVQTPAPLAPADQAKREGGIQLARTLPRYGQLRSFKGENAEERAYRFGQFLLASVLGNTKAREFCSQNGIALVRAMGESVNETGGYLVPDEFGNDLIDLREQFGVFRRNAKIVPMASDTRSDPRRTGGLTAYFVAEAGAITASDMGWDRVELVAKKLAVLARYSSEVNEDSSIAFGDALAGEIAYAFAEKEDRCGFLGDGTDTYGGIRGACNKLLNLSATRADIAGLVVGTGNLFAELVLGDFEAVVAKLPQYADTDAAAWYVHRSFYWNVMVKAMLASGGVTAAEIEDARKQRFMGYRVEFSQVMPNTDANDQIVALFGDLAKAASMGTRRDTQIALSEHSRFANDQIEIRGTERFDINVHDVGNQSSTASSRVAGPIVGLASAAS
jgi:HK97 family phage major capsid protein/HK97 family phage prohead protease